MSFSTLSIQFNGIMPYKNGHHHHHQWTIANCIYQVTPKVFKLRNSTTTSSFLMWCRAYCPRMSADILGTNCDQCQSMVQCCFMSTETVRLIRTESLGQPPQLSRSSWTPTSFLTKWDDLLQQPSVLPGAYRLHEDATRSPVKAHHQLWLRPGSGQLSFRAVHDTINSLGKAICAPPHLSAVQKQSAITAAHLPSLSWVPWWPWGSAVESPHWECPVPSNPHLSESGMPPYPPAHTKSYIFGTRLL